MKFKPLNPISLNILTQAHHRAAILKEDKFLFATQINEEDIAEVANSVANELKPFGIRVEYEPYKDAVYRVSMVMFNSYWEN